MNNAKRPLGCFASTLNSIINISRSINAGRTERIRKELLKDGGDGLAGEVGALTAAVRDLWQLLRARMR